MIDLTIVIVSYNTATITLNCIRSIIKSLSENSETSYEIIVVDNHSQDDSQAQISRLRQGDGRQIEIKTIFNKKNVGFARANNQAAEFAKGRYLLFVNSDVIINRINTSRLITLFNQDKSIGALTVKLIRPNGKIDPACHRGFPSLWRSFCYFSKLEKCFGQLPVLNRIFGGYHLTYLDKNTVHEIDSPSGAFYLTRKKLFDEIKGFDENFFMYGEDLDLSYRIKNHGYKIIYYPLDEVTHLKYQSGLSGDDSDHQKKIRDYFYQAMILFYQKHYARKYPKRFNLLIYSLINYEKNRN